MKVAYSYSRVSSVEQIKGGGLERQLHLAKDYCKKHGYVLDETTTFSEKGKSAFNGANVDTGKLGVILKLIASGQMPKGSVLLVENLDRLARTEATEAMTLFLQIINSGISVVTLVDEKEYNKEVIHRDPTSLLISLIYFIRANDESKQKRNRITDAWRRQRIENIKNGVKDRHNIPSWLALEKNVFKPKTDKIKIIKKIFRMFSVDGIGVNAIARKLNDKGTPTLTGKKWSSCTTKFLLRNRGLIGEYHIGERITKSVKKKTGQVIKNYYPTIIDLNIFEKCQQRFLLNPAKKGRPKNNKEDDWLTPLLKCGYCGGAVGAEHHATSKTYICWRSVSGGCVRCGIDREWTQNGVKRILRESIREYIATISTNEKILEIESQIVESKKKISNLTKLVEGGIEDAVERVFEIKKNQRKLELKMAHLTAVQATENPVITPETLAAAVRRYVSIVKIYFAGDEKQKKNYVLLAKGKSGGYINKIIKPNLKDKGIPFMEVYFNPPWEERGWRFMLNWSTLPKESYYQFKVGSPNISI